MQLRAITLPPDLQAKQMDLTGVFDMFNEVRNDYKQRARERIINRRLEAQVVEAEKNREAELKKFELDKEQERIMMNYILELSAKEK